VIHLARARSGALATALLAGALVALAPAASAALPDGRAWEQVSPVDKNGADIGMGFSNAETGVVVSPDGNRVVFLSLTPFGDAPNGLLTTYYRADRAASGWSTRSISRPLPSAPNVLDSEVPGAFTPDLSAGVFTTPFPYDAGDDDADPLNFAPTGHFDQYLFGAAATPAWTSRGSQGGDAQVDALFGAATSDLSRVVFETPEALEPAAGPLLPQLTNQYYIYTRRAGQTQLVNVDDAGTLLDADGAVLGNGSSTGSGASANQFGTTDNAVSADGTRIFFESPPPTIGIAQLYMRDTAAGTTTHVSAPDAGVVDPNGTQAATFAGAAADGSKVFFTSTQQLTADDTNTSNDVYEYDTAAGVLTRVSRGESGTADAAVDGVVLAADDGSTVYFAAEHQLVGTQGADGSPNLYRYDTQSGTTTFVATLSPADQPRLWSGNDSDRQAYATADGGVLAFTSQAQLTAYDPAGHWEAYLYRAGTGTIECASCRPDGTPPAGDADFGPSPTFRNSFFIYGFPAPLTQDGRRVFFETTDSVVPQDANGDAPTAPFSGIPGPTDVYEYSGGTVSLISDGHSTDGSLLAGVSPSGDDAFFYTRAALVPQDTDGGNFDVYDARVGGGFPTPAGSAACQDDGCHPQPSAAPFLPAPGSTAVEAVRPGVPPPTFSVRPITRAAAARFARTGRVTLTVRVTAPGRVTAHAFARIARHDTRVGAASRAFRHAETGHMTVRLSRTARVRLRGHGRLALRIDTRYSRGPLERVAHVTLRRSSR